MPLLRDSLFRAFGLWNLLTAKFWTKNLDTGSILTKAHIRESDKTYIMKENPKEMKISEIMFKSGLKNLSVT